MVSETSNTSEYRCYAADFGTRMFLPLIWCWEYPQRMTLGELVRRVLEKHEEDDDA